MTTFTTTFSRTHTCANAIRFLELIANQAWRKWSTHNNKNKTPNSPFGCVTHGQIYTVFFSRNTSPAVAERPIAPTLISHQANLWSNNTKKKTSCPPRPKRGARHMRVNPKPANANKVFFMRPIYAVRTCNFFLMLFFNSSTETNENLQFCQQHGTKLTARSAMVLWTCGVCVCVCANFSSLTADVLKLY